MEYRVSCSSTRGEGSKRSRANCRSRQQYFLPSGGGGGLLDSLGRDKCNAGSTSGTVGKGGNQVAVRRSGRWWEQAVSM